MQSSSYWRLRPRDQIPALVRASIPLEDTYSFLTLLASQPLTIFDDCHIQKAIIKDAKEAQRIRKSQSMQQDDQFQQEKAQQVLANGNGRISTSMTTSDDVDMLDTLILSPLQMPKATRGVGGRRYIEREDITPVGPDFQADVPEWTGKLVEQKEFENVESDCLFRANDFPEGLVEKYLKRCNNHLVRRSGYPLSPMAEHRALRELSKEKGMVDLAIKRVLENVAKYALYDGEGEPWTDAERTLLLRTFANVGHDFEHMSRYVFKNRPTSEIVVYYYSRYEQIYKHHGGNNVGDMYDHGDRKSYATDRSTAAQIKALQGLAASAGDGFPPIQHVKTNMQLLRNARISRLSAEKRLADDRHTWKM